MDDPTGVQTADDSVDIRSLKEEDVGTLETGEARAEYGDGLLDRRADARQSVVWDLDGTRLALLGIGLVSETTVTSSRKLRRKVARVFATPNGAGGAPARGGMTG